MNNAPLPEGDWPLTRPFWEAAADGRLVLPRCGGCGRFVWYPEESCPYCGAGELPWVEVSGHGQLFSWAEVKHRLHPPYEDELPYVSGIVVLEDAPGVRLVTRIVDCRAEDLAMDQAVEVVYRTLRFKGVDGEVVAPVFRPRR